jgi:5-methylcytosine-specific restriction endonuclease McrA
MPFFTDLQELLEREEYETVGPAFGGTRPATRNSFSVATIRDWVLAQAPYAEATAIEVALNRASTSLDRRLFRLVVGNLIRFSFLIELTNLKVGSTKMKTRWLPGRILMPQAGSFEPIEGVFEPGNDPRAASFTECANIFAEGCNILCNQVQTDVAFGGLLLSLDAQCRVPYEIPLTYRDPAVVPVHQAVNIVLAQTRDLEWVLAARRILRAADPAIRPAIRELEKKKLEVKVFKTDRSLTGKDKTNRAKRWEVLAGDFQHATLEECWSAERKLTADLTCFDEFPGAVKGEFIAQGLIPRDASVTRCPVTFDPLNYLALATSVLGATHGVSDYQVGHLKPLKRGGKHAGENVCWQSADGNRIQGDLTIEETYSLLDRIAANRAALAHTPTGEDTGTS